MNDENLLLLPNNIVKLLNDLDTLRKTIIVNKTNIENLSITFNSMDKKLSKYLNKEINTILKKNEKNKKPKGIAMPTKVSDTLCNFMEQPINTKISRTNATKYLMNYIKTKQLIDPNNKKIIIPDNILWGLIGDEAKNEETLDYFKIQKYLNNHFIV
jgi:TPP-dependent 2-oxoacid decarboxylase